MVHMAKWNNCQLEILFLFAKKETRESHIQHQMWIRIGIWLTKIKVLNTQHRLKEDFKGRPHISTSVEKFSMPYKNYFDILLFHTQ